MPHINSFHNEFIEHVRAGSPCIWVQTTEQLHLDKLLTDCATKLGCQVREWNLGYGWVRFNNKQPLLPLEPGQTPSLAQDLAGLRDEDLDGLLIVIKNAQLALEHDKTAVARIQLLLHRIQRQLEGRAAVVLVGEHLDIGVEIDSAVLAQHMTPPRFANHIARRVIAWLLAHHVGP